MGISSMTFHKNNASYSFPIFFLIKCVNLGRYQGLIWMSCFRCKVFLSVKESTLGSFTSARACLLPLMNTNSESKIRSHTLGKLYFRFLSNRMGYVRGDASPFDLSLKFFVNNISIIYFLDFLVINLNISRD